jgi:DNA-binding LacI/PurR family transcriptional regulator
MSVTSAQVAKAAGVSRATVSYVLNDAPGRVLSAETRETVLRVARELGYQPNALARSLKRGRSNTVLFPVNGVAPNHVLSTLLDAVSEALAVRGLGLVRDFSVLEDPAAQADAWAELAPAAVLDLVLHHDDQALRLLRDRGVPVLSTALRDDQAWESSGDVFAREQRLAQLRYLISQGHRTIRWMRPVALPVDPRSERTLVSSMRKEARAAGVRLEFAAVDVENVAATVAGWSSLPDAIAAHNDAYAIAVLTALLSRGARVPDDVALIGADDEPLGRVVTPSLTTIAGDFSSFAVAVADAVEAVLAGRTTAPLPVPDLTLVVRDSA